MSDMVLLTGGRGHPAHASAGSLAAIAGDLGLGLRTDEDVDAGAASLDPDQDALLVVNALRFTMIDARYDDVRADEAFSPSSATRTAIVEWHRRGKPILALHTGVLCFDDWPEWAGLLGARWDWGVSSHPPRGAFTVEYGEARFEIVDECYRDLDLDPSIDPVATSGDGHPLAWICDGGPGRVAVDLLGHDARSLDHPGHRRLLTDLIRRSLEPRP